MVDGRLGIPILVSAISFLISGCSDRKIPSDTTVYPVAGYQLPAEDPYERRTFVQPPVITRPLPQASNAPLIQPPAETKVAVSPRLPQPRRKY